MATTLPEASRPSARIVVPPIRRSGVEVSTTNSTATPVGFTASWYVLALERCYVYGPLLTFALTEYLQYLQTTYETISARERPGLIPG